MKECKGITLIELLIILALIGITVSLASPVIKAVSAIKAKSTMQEIAHLTYLARQIAITSGSYSTICPTKNFISCNDDWGQPLMVFTDQNKNEVVDQHDEIIHIYDPKLTSFVLEPHFSLGKTFLQFNGRGFTNGTFGNVVLLKPGNNSKEIYKFIITRIGRIRLEKL